jgi:hypothetical protein
MITTVIKCGLVPLLLFGSMFSPMAGAYEERLVTAVWLGAMIAVVLALRGREYFLAAGMSAVTIVFSPMTLPIKIFALLGYACVVSILALRAVWKLRTLTPAR